MVAMERLLLKADVTKMRKLRRRPDRGVASKGRIASLTADIGRAKTPENFLH
jgi:hypothetical protein